MTATLVGGAGFFLGLSFALLPAVGPFLALLFLLSARLELRRSDLMWVAAAALYGLAPLAAGHIEPFLTGTLQFGAGWLIYRAFEEIRPTRFHMVKPSIMAAGLLMGLCLVVGFHLVQIQAWNFQTSKTIAQALVWQSSPALFGHTVLVLGGLIAIVSRGWWFRLGAIGVSALGILVSGSREAAIGWIVIVIALQFARRAQPLRARLAELGIVLVMIALSTGLGPRLGWGQVGFLLTPAGDAEATNLLQGTELPSGDWWDRSWVEVSAAPADIGGQRLQAYRVRKAGSEPWLRLQQGIQIEPGATYTVSSWIRSGADDIRPGFQGWGQIRDEGIVRSFVVSGTLRRDRFTASVTGPGTLLDAGIAARDRAWSRVFATFRYEGTEPLSFFVGLAPDARRVPGGVATFAGFQLQLGALGPYEPGSATRGLALEDARLPYWQAAIHGIERRPLLGSGVDSFPASFLDDWPGRGRLHVVPAHAHNMFLHIWFERGLAGLAGVALLLVALAARAMVRRDLPLLAVIAAVVLANTFDTTLLYGGVFYPLVAVAGWRAGAREEVTPERTASARQVAVRATLVGFDAVAALLSFFTASNALAAVARLVGGQPVASDLPTTGLYALLLWPILCWREGLYPGYGLTAPQELKKQVASATYAGLLLASVLLLFPDAIALPVDMLMLSVACSYVWLPAARAAAKRLLTALALWGRPVVILGAGETGARLAQALQRAPLDGLDPVAFFDDDRSLHGANVEGIPVRGQLREADAFARDHAVRHAIVAIPRMAAHRLRGLLDTNGRQFRVVQYIPDLAGLPAEELFASTLDGMLALEIRNNLASRTNRAGKRLIDLVGSALLLLLVAPILVAVAIWVRADSRGPALYRAERVGQDGTRFPCLKFRTMLADAEERLESLLDGDPTIRDEYMRFHKLENDPRITRVGRILRTYSLDELPQLLNVLVGHMSLVGPRPYLPRELPHMTELREIVLQAKPGLTGYWQVSRRNEVGFSERVSMEAHYVRNWSIWWDIVILIRTIPAIVAKRGK